MPDDIRADEPRHPETTALRVAAGGVMVRMGAETLAGQDRVRGGRDAAGGGVAELDATGAILCQRTYARRPATGKTGLKRPISAPGAITPWGLAPDGAGQCHRAPTAHRRCGRWREGQRVLP